MWSSNPTLGHIPRQNYNSKNTCTPMFIAALFTIAKTWKQPKRPSTDEWIKKMWYIYTMEYFSAMKKNEIMPFEATWMQLEIIILSEFSKRKTNTIWYHLYVESKIRHKWPYLRNRNILTVIENRLLVAKLEGGRGGMNWEVAVSRCKLLYIEWLNNKVLLYSTGSYIQYPVINRNGKEYKKRMCIYIYNWIIFLYSRN